jgi:hypothetical protein
LWLRLCDRLGLNQRRRRHRRAAIEIGDRIGRFRSRHRSEFVGDRSRQSIFRPVAAPAAAAATSATPRATLAVLSLIDTRRTGRLVAILFVGFALIGNRAFDGFGC